MGAVGDYAAIGDTNTIALIGRDGSTDWCCLPRFDAPAVFLRLLDEQRGGAFRVGPKPAFASRRAYVAGTNVLETMFESDAAVVRVTDWMPWRDPRIEGRRALVRDVCGLSGDGTVEVSCRPTFDFARERAEWRRFDGGSSRSGGVRRWR